MQILELIVSLRTKGLQSCDVPKPQGNLLELALSVGSRIPRILNKNSIRVEKFQNHNRKKKSQQESRSILVTRGELPVKSNGLATPGLSVTIKSAGKQPGEKQPSGDQTE